jgi:hypothetical protein
LSFCHQKQTKKCRRRSAMVNKKRNVRLYKPIHIFM